MFGPTIKSENIPGTPMESIDALLVSESIDIGSASDSSLIHDASHTISNHKSQTSRRSSAKATPSDGDDKSHTMPNSNVSSQFINNERIAGERPSITSSDDPLNSKRPKQEVSVHVSLFCCFIDPSASFCFHLVICFYICVSLKCRLSIQNR